MGKKLDLVGQRFGRLVVLSKAEENSHGRTRFNCQCDCGNAKIAIGSLLNNGGVRSCGCLVSDAIREANTTHGHAKNGNISPTFRTWCSVIQRCTDKNGTGYKKYGAKGITVCDRWLNSFESFLADMGERPSSKYSIDRIDPRQGYYPENCRWATMKEQQNNRTNNRLITVDGQTKTLMQWSECLGMNHTSIIGRINRGMNLKDAVTKQRMREKVGPIMLDVSGELISIMDLSRKTGIQKATLLHRIFKIGMSPSEAISVPVRPWGSKKSTAVKRTDVEVFSDAQFIDSDFQPGRTDCIAASS